MSFSSRSGAIRLPLIVGEGDMLTVHEAQDIGLEIAQMLLQQVSGLHMRLSSTPRENSSLQSGFAENLQNAPLQSKFTWWGQNCFYCLLTHRKTRGKRRLERGAHRLKDPPGSMTIGSRSGDMAIQKKFWRRSAIHCRQNAGKDSRPTESFIGKTIVTVYIKPMRNG